MEGVTTTQIRKILSSIKYPGFTRDIVSFGVLKNIEIKNKEIVVNLVFTTKNDDVKKQIVEDVQRTISSKISGYNVNIITENISERRDKQEHVGGDPWADRAPIPGIKNIIAIASGKGGVGKSTVSTNLSLALSKHVNQVGLMDSDIYGPSIHVMMGIEERPKITTDQKIIPIEKYGIRLMSMGFLIDTDAPLIWRGPLVMKAVEQFLHDVVWGELDILVIDLPPGTGDAQLTLVQKTPLTGAVIVTTPQEVALIDARRGLKMFQKVNTKVLGLVENMSYFVCPKCGEKTYIFGNEGGVRSAKDLNVPLLGQIPIEPDVRIAGDDGVPIIIRDPESHSAKAFLNMAEKMIKDDVFHR